MEIELLIVHNINVNNDLPIYSEKATFLVNMEEEERNKFEDFFSKHIETQKMSNKALPATFKKLDDDENIVQEYIAAFKNTQNLDYLKISKKLTKKLHTTMQGNSKSDGILIFVKYKNHNNNYLCIMKMNPEVGLKHNPETNRIELIDGMLPDSSRKLHKASFFNLDTLSNDDYSFHVLDKQQSGDTVSNFFIETYLEAKLNFNDRTINKIFHNSLNDLMIIVEDNHGIEDIQKLDYISKHFKALFSSVRKIQIVEEVYNIVENVTDNAEQADDISKEWARHLEKKHSAEIYYSFETEINNNFNTVYTDVNKRVTFQYDADLESKNAISVNTEGQTEIVITIDKSYIENFEKL